MDGIHAGAHVAPGVFAEETRKAKELFRQVIVFRGVLLVASVGALGTVAYLLMPIKAVPMDAHTAETVMNSLGFLAALSAICATCFVPAAIPLRVADKPHEHHMPHPRAIYNRLHARAIHAGSWSTIPAVLGFALVVLGFDVPVYLGFLAATVASSALSFPRWSHWERVCTEADAATETAGGMRLS